MIRYFVTLLLAFFFITSSLQSQELNCKVTVTHRDIQNVDAKVFKSLEKGLNEFMNGKKWTTDIFQNNEKIECSFLVNLTKQLDENVYQGTLSITASRPVYGTTYTTSVLKFVERAEDFTFKFEESQTLLFDENRIVGSDALASNLTAIFAYYAYLILGYDYDSFSPLGGTEYFKKANAIVINAPEDAKISGWKSSDRNNTNRYWIVEQLLNPRYEIMRTAWYDYHRLGLDMMSSKPDEGLEKIFTLLRSVDEINKSFQNPAIVKLMMFAKSLEYENFLSQYPAEKRKDYIDILARIDVPNAAKYKAVK